MRRSALGIPVAVGLIACSAIGSGDRSSVLESAFQSLAACGDPDIGEEVGQLRANDAPTHDDAVILDDGQSGYLFVCHLFWTVAVCAMDRDLKVLDVRSFPAKCGFALDGRIVTFHEHPGTGMLFDTRRLVSVEQGKLVIEELGWHPVENCPCPLAR
jgi:hypothetical protein